MFVFFLLNVALVVAIVTLLLWSRVRYVWLERLAFALVLSFPFERIPSFDAGVGTLKISHFLVLASCYVLGLLLLQKNPRLLAQRIHPVSWIIFGFFIVSVPSLWFVESLERFAVTYLAVFLSMATLFFVTHFLKDAWRALLWLCVACIFIGFFGVYQFGADMLGLPSYLSGVKPLFQKHVFGVPRLLATFNEPSYFANGLYLPLSAYVILLARRINVATYLTLPSGLRSWFTARTYLRTYQYILGLLLGCFVLTLAKSAWLVAPIVWVPLLGFLEFRRVFSKTLRRRFLVGLGVFVAVAALASAIPDTPAQKFYTHALGTLTGRSSTASERSVNFEAAVAKITQKPLTGYGSGQFGTVARSELAARFTRENIPISTDNPAVIVFNVYAEVWLEYGFLAFLLFLGLVGWAFYITWYALRGQDFLEFSPTQLAQFIVSLYLLLSVLQWNFISPLYLNSIFIGLGLLYNIHYRTHYVRA